MHSEWKIRLDGNQVWVGERFAISFQRTLRIPDDGRAYPLPPTLGQFPVHLAADHAAAIPAEWELSGAALKRAVFIPMYQCEALWLAFEAAEWKPNAVKIAAGRVNALSGAVWEAGLHADPQDYIVCPGQPWLDGFKTGSGAVRQFVAMPLGQGYTAEAQLSGQEQFGGIQVQVYDPRPGVFPDQPPPPPPADALPGAMMGAPFGGLFGAPFGGPPGEALALMSGPPPLEMGLAAGGEITQKVYPDPYGLETWEAENFGELQVFIVTAARYVQITGLPPPPTPVDAQAYTRYGLPWFELYDEEREDLPAAQALAGLQSVAALDAAHGRPAAQENQTIDIPEAQKHPLNPIEPRE